MDRDLAALRALLGAHNYLAGPIARDFGGSGTSTGPIDRDFYVFCRYSCRYSRFCYCSSFFEIVFYLILEPLGVDFELPR